MDTRVNSADTALRERARRVIPGGLWGHMNADRLPEGYPQYFARGEGCRLTDVDGRSFVDLMCAWGPIILGHCHPVAEAAAREQTARGDCMNGPGPVLVDLAETLVAMIPHAAWCQFGKNGTDATTGCVTIARAGTGRRKVLVARGAYHGAVPWCSPSVAGVTAEDRAHLLHFNYNDVDSIDAAVEAAGGDLAAIVVSAFRHDMGVAQEMPSLAFAWHVRSVCDSTGAALILDDVRAGFRLHLGGSWETLGVRPDLSAFSKAIGNGYALAAVTGREWLRDAATQVFSTGSFWCGAVAMAAAVATLGELRRVDAPAVLLGLGERLREGLAERAAFRRVRISQSGPAAMPTVLFEDDPEWKKGYAFCAEALRHGAYLHPKHNMFLSCAHTEADIDVVLEAADRGFQVVGR
jgi:glutamate-1-semialdehyde 2,1-aminomutase